MHARFCSPLLGRFLSPDPMGAEPNRPQGWNRYAYALNNPLKWVDPTGETVSLADLEEGDRTILLEKLKEFTGNTYGVNENLELVLLEVGATSSQTATDYLNTLIAPEPGVFNVLATEGRNRADSATKAAYANFSSFDDVKYGKVDPTAFSLEGPPSSMSFSTRAQVSAIGTDIPRTSSTSAIIPGAAPRSTS